MVIVGSSVRPLVELILSTFKIYQVYSTRTVSMKNSVNSTALGALQDYGSDDEDSVSNPICPTEGFPSASTIHDDTYDKDDEVSSVSVSLVAMNPASSINAHASLPPTSATRNDDHKNDNASFQEALVEYSPSRTSSTSQHRMSRRVRQFLDVEALEDDADEDDDEDSAIDEDDSIQGGALAPQPITTSPIYTRGPQNSLTRLIHHLEDIYVLGHRNATVDSDIEMAEESTTDITQVNHREQDWVETLLRESTHMRDDWVLFRADCQAGSEYQILFNIMESSVLQREVRSSFYNPSLGSHIYFEASIPNDHPSVLLEFLSVHSDIYASSLYCVPATEHKSCLRILPCNDRIFSPGTWVKINQPGLYSGDTGLVRGLRHIPGRLNIAVLLVPRILRESDHPDPSRPEMSLLTEDHLDEDEMEMREIDGHSYFIYDKQCFEFGLLAAYFSPAMLSVAAEISCISKITLSLETLETPPKS
ncbi:hypothetical protein F5878DRAFT_701199 [Lentinula raphanica]|uniref:Uncharacterized protein n=1 Tax=Lentinula raphanica TaxID=153919 RepID=A0AA38U6F5_9AGAR|nr:hypothetical protein F5878DRAFT_701199 [Lentinula raphanica]